MRRGNTGLSRIFCRNAKAGDMGARHCVSARAARRYGNSGFTLIEVLVAMTLLAIGIAISISLISKSLNNIRRIETRTRIVDHANSVMDLTLLDQEIREPGAFEGDFEDGTRWTMRIEEYTPDDDEMLDQAVMSTRLLSYTVEMFLPGSGVVEYRLRTLKLVPYQ